MAKAPNKSSGNYEVGYGRPPKASQFKSGQSGNPKGRPKEQPTTSDIFLREAARIVRIKVGDKVETISKLDAVIRRLYQMAIAGDARAIGMLLAAYSRLDAENEAGHTEAGGNAVDAMVPSDDALRRMLARFDHITSG